MDGKKLRKIWDQVPSDYYETGNLLQKYWHGGKWENIRTLFSPGYRKILDVGCASGHITNKIKALYPDAEVIGLDVSNKFLAFAKKRYPGVKFVLADAHSLPFPDRHFDLILSSESLEHVVNPGKVLLEIKRCLSKKGDFVVSMDSGSGLFSFVWKYWTTWGPGRVWRGSHLTHFDAKLLTDMVKEAGFKIAKSKIGHFGMAIFIKAKLPKTAKRKQRA